MAPVPLELAVAVKALAHWVTTGLPLVIATPLLGLLLNLAPRHRRGDADAAGRNAGADLPRRDRRRADRGAAPRRASLSVLILPFPIPVLIFGVAAANAAIVGPMPFGRLPHPLRADAGGLVVGPVAAAVALRPGWNRCRCAISSRAHCGACGPAPRELAMALIDLANPTASWPFAARAAAVARRPRPRSRSRSGSISRSASRPTITSRARR